MLIADDLTQEVADLEQEVADAESRCTHLRAALKAAIVEARAAQDPAQFDLEGLRARRAARPDDRSAMLGLAVGTAGGILTSVLLGVFLL